MADGPAPGWYKSSDGTDSYWDGSAWHTPSAREDATDEPPSTVANANGATASVVSEAVQTPTVPPVRRNGRRVWITLSAAVAFLCVAGVAAYWFLLRGDTDTWAMDECKSEVSEILKSPTTAAYSDLAVYPLDERYYLFPALLLTGIMEADDIDIEEAVDAMEFDRDKYNAQATAWLASQPGRDIRIVTGTVNSQNGFGATVESDFVCLYDDPQDAEPTVRVVAFDNKFLDSEWAIRFMRPIGPEDDGDTAS